MHESLGDITSVRDIIATVTLCPPNQKKSGVLTYIKHGWLALPFKFSWGVLRNLLKTDKFNEGEIAKAANHEPYFYLTMVAVHTTFRGTPIASEIFG